MNGLKEADIDAGLEVKKEHVCYVDTEQRALEECSLYIAAGNPHLVDCGLGLSNSNYEEGLGIKIKQEQDSDGEGSDSLITVDCQQSCDKGGGAKMTCRCCYCDKLFARPSILNTHMRRHTGEKPFRCEDCGRCFSQNSTLVRHNIELHNKKRPYFSCSICGKVFKLATNLTNHLCAHTGEKRFHCKVCGKRFIKNYLLVRHLRKHTADKPFVCNTCNAGFKYSKNLSTHVIRMHSARNAFVCKICNVRFEQEKRLTNHVRRQHSVKEKNLLSCPHCKTLCKDSSALDAHINLTHNAMEKLSGCDLCEKPFNRETFNKFCFRVQAGDFSCKQCNDRFAGFE